MFLDSFGPNVESSSQTEYMPFRLPAEAVNSKTIVRDKCIPVTKLTLERASRMTRRSSVAEERLQTSSSYLIA